MSPKYSDLEGGEQTPSLGPKVINVKKKNSIQSKLDNKKGNEKCWTCMIIFSGLICMGILALIIYFIVNYYQDTFKERENIDNKISIVSEKWMDYTTNTQVNCSNINPCSEWDCEYIYKHFHKTLDECDYDDYMTLVTIILIIFGPLICCHACFGQKK